MNTPRKFSGIGSAAIHSGRSGHAEHAHLSPIFATSTFTFDSAEQGMNRFSGKEEGYIYSRFGNPTVAVAEELIAALEAFDITAGSGEALQLKTLLCSSGQSAMATMFLCNLSAGDTVLSHHSLYGGTHEFLYNILPEYGINSIIADLRDLNSLEAIIKKTPVLKLIHIETPANPTMDCVDLEQTAKLAKQYGILVTVDNTFATPYLQQPFRYGVDFVFHSTTKFLNGHGTSIGGALVGRDIHFMKTKAAKYHKLFGGNSNPFDAYLLTLGIRTLELRMERHCSNANAVGNYLFNHPAIAKVNYNGLIHHPDYETSRRQMRYAGAVLSFEVKGGMKAGKAFIDRLQMCVRAVSLGTVDTLISHPASMSHSGLTAEERVSSGITDGLIRMSVGIENIEDILQDLDQALSSLV